MKTKYKKTQNILENIIMSGIALLLIIIIVFAIMAFFAAPGFVIALAFGGTFSFLEYSAIGFGTIILLSLIIGLTRAFRG